MTEDKILTKEEVLRDGVCFEDELDWGGEYYDNGYRHGLAVYFYSNGKI